MEELDLLAEEILALVETLDAVGATDELPSDLTARIREEERRYWRTLARSVDLARRSRQEAALSTQQLGRSLAHELRNRLGAAETSLRFLSSTAGPVPADRRARVLEIVEGSLESALESVRMLDAIGTDDQARVDRVAFDIVVRRTLDELRPLAAGRGVELVSGALPSLSVPRHLTRMTLSNLVGNAIKYAPEGASDPHVEVSAVEEDGRVVGRVSDNGPGIPESRHAEIFDPAVQLDDESAGWGMGLSLVSRALRRAGGSIMVESDAGDGATFIFTIPVSEAPSDG